jgi:hypothetical protein
MTAEQDGHALEEHGLTQATIGPIVAEAASFAQQLSQRTAVDAADALRRHRAAAAALGPSPSGSAPELLAVASSVAIAAVSPGAVPTEVNVAQHMRALELQDAAPQRVGRFLRKPAGETSEGGGSWHGTRSATAAARAWLRSVLSRRADHLQLTT